MSNLRKWHDRNSFGTKSQLGRDKRQEWLDNLEGHFLRLEVLQLCYEETKESETVRRSDLGKSNQDDGVCGQCREWRRASSRRPAVCSEAALSCLKLP